MAQFTGYHLHTGGDCNHNIIILNINTTIVEEQEQNTSAVRTYDCHTGRKLCNHCHTGRKLCNHCHTGRKCNQGEKPYVKTQITIIGEGKNLRTANTNIVEGEKLSNHKYHYL